MFNYDNVVYIISLISVESKSGFKLVLNIFKYLF